MFCIKPYLNETERGKEGGENAALPARAGRGRGGPAEGRARPAEAPWAPATGWRRGRRLSPAGAELTWAARLPRPGPGHPQAPPGREEGSGWGRGTAHPSQDIAIKELLEVTAWHLWAERQGEPRPQHPGCRAGDPRVTQDNLSRGRVGRQEGEGDGESSDPGGQSLAASVSSSRARREGGITRRGKRSAELNLGTGKGKIRSSKQLD